MSYFPEKFVSEIQLHLIRNSWNATKKNSPLLLGISGCPGEGKTYQSKKILEMLGYGVIGLSTSDFGSALEAESAKFLCAKYVEATALTRIYRKPYVLICDDIDVAIGQWGNLTQYTVNRQYAVGELMHLCDSPELVRVDREKLSKQAADALNIEYIRDRYIDIATLRTPIILTGNDFGKLYDPLRRSGRMTHFEWNPGIIEKSNVVASILSITSDQANSLVVEAYRLADSYGIIERPPISFFASMKSRAQDSHIKSIVAKYGWTCSQSKFASDSTSDFQIPVETYYSILDDCISELRIISHLQSETTAQTV